MPSFSWAVLAKSKWITLLISNQVHSTQRDNGNQLNHLESSKEEAQIGKMEHLS